MGCYLENGQKENQRKKFTHTHKHTHTHTNQDCSVSITLSLVQDKLCASLNSAQLSKTRRMATFDGGGGLEVGIMENFAKTIGATEDALRLLVSLLAGGEQS